MNKTKLDSLSLSQRLHEQLRDLIDTTAPGDRLPSEPELARQLGVSRATLREAMRIFETQGLIHRRQGIGTFVARSQRVIETGLEVLESIQALAKRIGLPVSMGEYEAKLRPPNSEECAVLDIGENEPVVEVAWTMKVEDRPVAYLIDILPEDVISVETIQRDFSGSVLDMLLARGDLALNTSRTEINAIAARPEIARALGIQRGDVVLYFVATLYSDAGRVVDYSYSYFLPGYFRFHVNRQVGGSKIRRGKADKG